MKRPQAEKNVSCMENHNNKKSIPYRTFRVIEKEPFWRAQRGKKRWSMFMILLLTYIQSFVKLKLFGSEFNCIMALLGRLGEHSGCVGALVFLNVFISSYVGDIRQGMFQFIFKYVMIQLYHIPGEISADNIIQTYFNIFQKYIYIYICKYVRCL